MWHVKVSLMMGMLVPFTPSVAAEIQELRQPIKVILLSGRNNHDWRRTTPMIRSILYDTGHFQVSIEEHPEQLTAAQLQNFQVILSNWNSYGEGESEWPEATKQAYVDFVRKGGGHVVVHAGSASFPDWDAYHRVTLATWKLGQTGHGPPHIFTVCIDAVGHPIATGLSDFAYHGELWHCSALQEDVTIVASAMSSKEYHGSGQREPVAVAKQVGQGRSFTFLLGHSADEMENEGFRTLLINGTQWAASKKVYNRQ